MFQAVVFDMDGVILDSEKIYRMCEHREAAKYGLDDSKVDSFCNLIAGGKKEGNRKHFEEIFPEAPVDYYVYREGVMKAVDRYAEENGYELKHGVKEILDFLKGKNILTALATSTSHERAEKHLRAHGIYDKFDRIVYGNEVKKGKPAPDIYLKACEEISVEPSRAIGVEDSINGVLSSHSAGLFTVMVVDLIPPDERIEGKADRVFRDITEIEGLF